MAEVDGQVMDENIEDVSLEMEEVQMVEIEEPKKISFSRIKDTDVDEDLNEKFKMALWSDRTGETLKGESLGSAVDIAIQLLLEGREVQKISVIRSLPDLVSTHQEECLVRVLPLVQDKFRESINLDLHCEGALAYRSILTKPSVSADTRVAVKIVKGVRSNLESPDSSAGAAWLETLLDIVDFLPREAIKNEVLPVAITQSQQTKSSQRRVTSIRIFEKIVPKLDPNEIKSEVVPCVQALCQDVNAHVRTNMCDRLPCIAAILNSVEYSSLILPLLVDLCGDDDVGVQESALDVLGGCITNCDRKTMSEILVPLIQKSSEKAYHMANTTLCIVAKNFGLWCHSLYEVLNAEQRGWFLSMYGRLSQMGRASTESSLMTQSDPEGLSLGVYDSCNPIHIAAREWTAHNYPGMLLTFGCVDALSGVLERLCQDPEDAVRKKIAGGFHEVAKLLRPSETNTALMHECFMDLIRGGDMEVVGALTHHFPTTLPILYALCQASVDANGNPNTAQQRMKLNRMLVACNRLVRNCSNWRCHEAYLKGISCLRHSVPNEELFQTFAPVLKEETLSSRAIPCRVAAFSSLLILVRDSGTKEQLTSVVDFFVETLCNHQSCHKRQLFLDVCSEVLNLYSHYAFKKHFFSAALKLTDDKVFNVRLKACKLLPRMKATLELPPDDPLLVNVESAMKNLIAKETNPRNLDLIQQIACELSNTEESDAWDVRNLAKEKKERDRFGSPPPRPDLPPPKPKSTRPLPSKISSTPSTPVGENASLSTLRPLSLSHSVSAVSASTAKVERRSPTEKTNDPSVPPKTEMDKPKLKTVEEKPCDVGPNTEKGRSESKVGQPPTIPSLVVVEDSSEKKLRSPTAIRVHRPRTAIVRPQPKMIMTRSPSPRPDLQKPDGEKSPPLKTTPTDTKISKYTELDKKHDSTIIDRSKPPIPSSGIRNSSHTSSPPSSLRMTRSDSQLKPPTGLERRKPTVSSASTVTTSSLTGNSSTLPRSMGSSSLNSGSKTLPNRPVRSSVGSVLKSVQRWESKPVIRDPNGNRTNISVTTRSERKQTAYSTVGPTNITDRNNNPGRSGIPLCNSLSGRRNSLPGKEERDRANGRGSLSHCSSMSTVERRLLTPSGNKPSSPYGLMKVQSASAIHHRSSSVMSFSSRRKL